jgi:formylglycine-generating enzyme required for sulfatase activity
MIIKKNNLIVSFLFFSSFIAGCDITGDLTWEVDTNIYQGIYKMIEVPVPQGGITFPIGVNNDDTAYISKAYYLGETQITFGLYQTVCMWAEKEKTGERYNNLYYPGYVYPEYTDNKQSIYDYPMCAVTYFEILVWCNAYTEWHNEKYGTNYTPVYTDSAGVPIRNSKVAYSPTYMQGGFWSTVEECFASYYQYIEDYPKMRDYIANVETTGTGFRLPTPNEWELAARWRGTDNINTVTETINGINFSAGSVRFTRGNSASGAGYPTTNLNETHQYAVFEYNSNGKLSLPKTKRPNTLGFYDMCGNLREFVYHIEHIEVPSEYDVWGTLVAKADYPFAQTRGGYFYDIYDPLALGASIYVDATAYNYYYGFRVARSK